MFKLVYLQFRFNFEMFAIEKVSQRIYLGKMGKKDKTESFEKSGIHHINYNDYNEEYFGQSRRDIRTRYV